MAAPPTVKRVNRAFREHGVTGVARKAAKRVQEGPFTTDYYIWYELPLQAERPARPVPEGIVIRQATADEIGLLAQLDRDPELGRQYHADGHELWLALDGETPAFGCWIFRGSAPLHGGDWLTLPTSLPCLEDSVTSPDYRGRGLAPAAWCQIADALAEEGGEALITKVGTKNLPSRRAVLKAGFVDAGLMHFSTFGSIHRIRLDVLNRGTGEELQRLLET